MLETYKHFFDPQGVQGCSRGPVFPKSAFLVFLIIFLQTWAEIDARNLPKKFLTPRGDSKRGPQGGRFSSNIHSWNSTFFCNFGKISSNLSWDRCQKPSKKNWLSGGPGGRVIGGSWGASFLKICILGIFGDISSNLSWDRCQKPPKKCFDSQGAK